MKHTITRTVTEDVDITYLMIKAGVRYWEDATVNGVEDKDGTLIPKRDGEYWCPVIDIDEGRILNWPKGTTAEIHYKVCDDGTYILANDSNREILKIEGYVPDIACPEGEGYGDYIIMNIDGNGKIAKWREHPPIDDFIMEVD